MSPKFPIPGLTAGFAPTLSRFLLCSLFFCFSFIKNSNYDIYICIQLTSILGKHYIWENIIKSTIICAIFKKHVTLLCRSSNLLFKLNMIYNTWRNLDQDL